MKKYIALFLFIIFAFTNMPVASALLGGIANCSMLCFLAGTPIKTKTGFKPIETGAPKKGTVPEAVNCPLKLPAQRQKRTGRFE